MKQLLCGLGVVGFLLSTAAPAAAPGKILMVTLGGYNSCSKSTRSDLPPLGTGLYPRSDKMSQAVSTKSRGLKILWIAACLEGDAPPDGEGQYVHYDQPKHLSYGDARKIRNEIEAVAKAEPGIPVFIAGHSYGGWMSMYLAEELNASVKIAGLFTVDPIGPACGPAGVFFGDPACHSAPDDFDNKAILKRVGTWVNFYQTADSWLTSSAIAEAENHEVIQTWGPHGDIDSDPGVWKRIQQAVEKAVGP